MRSAQLSKTFQPASAEHDSLRWKVRGARWQADSHQASASTTDEPGIDQCWIAPCQDGADPTATQAADSFWFAYQSSMLKEPILAGPRRTMRLDAPADYLIAVGRELRTSGDAHDRCRSQTRLRSCGSCARVHASGTNIICESR
jgi:hypothetical protein